MTSRRVKAFIIATVLVASTARTIGYCMPIAGGDTDSEQSITPLAGRRAAITDPYNPALDINDILACVNTADSFGVVSPFSLGKTSPNSSSFFKKAYRSELHDRQPAIIDRGVEARSGAPFARVAIDFGDYSNPTEVGGYRAAAEIAPDNQDEDDIQLGPLLTATLDSLLSKIFILDLNSEGQLGFTIFGLGFFRPDFDASSQYYYLKYLRTVTTSRMSDLSDTDRFLIFSPPPDGRNTLGSDLAAPPPFSIQEFIRTIIIEILKQPAFYIILLCFGTTFAARWLLRKVRQNTTGGKPFGQG